MTLLINKDGEIIPKLPAPYMTTVKKKCAMVFHLDMEILAMEVREDETEFEIEDMEEAGGYTILTCIIRGTTSRVYTDYIFGEPFKVYGMASDYCNAFDYLAERMKVPADRLLILERINKTQL